jgi:gliding motility-associated-like protein
MKYLLSLIILFIFTGSSLFSQTIKADTTSGCDSLRISFRLEPPVVLGSTISWNFGNGATSTGNVTPVATYSTPGKYTVTCLINNTTTLTATNLIKIYKTPSAKFRYTDSLEISQYSYVFNHIRAPGDTGTIDLNWQFSDGGSSTASTFTYTFAAAGEYLARLIAKASNGCADTTTRTIGVANILEVSNVFTPNDDAINDYFIVRTDGILTYTFSVYTRSGVLVYRSESPEIFWDGRGFSGQVLTQGLYYYTIEQKETSPVTKLKGIIYLLR